MGVTRRSDTARGARRRARRSPGSSARPFDLSGLCDGAAFLRLGLAAVRPLCQVGAILRGDLLQYGETRARRRGNLDPSGSPRRGDRCDGGKGSGMSRGKG